jgi:DNA-binding PadR family transcriptional regulator
MSYKYLILGLLSDRPMSGYDIKKEVKTALGAVTSASYGTLYPTLHKLLADGYVEMQEIPQRGRPSKKVYRLTESGRHDLQGWLQEPALADQVRREFLLKLYLARNLGEQELKSIVTNRRQETETMLHSLLADRQNATTAQQAWIMDYVQSLYEAEVNWLRNFEERFGLTQ